MKDAAGAVATGRRPPPMSAGEALPASMARQYREVVGQPLIDGIGSTEMLHVFISAADEDARPGATGKAVAGFQAAAPRPRRADSRGVRAHLGVSIHVQDA